MVCQVQVSTNLENDGAFYMSNLFGFGSEYGLGHCRPHWEEYCQNQWGYLLTMNDYQDYKELYRTWLQLNQKQ